MGLLKLRPHWDNLSGNTFPSLSLCPRLYGYTLETILFPSTCNILFHMSRQKIIIIITNLTFSTRLTRYIMKISTYSIQKPSEKRKNGISHLMLLMIKCKYTWIKSITIAKITFAASVKKLTLIGLNMNFPSTLDI